MVLPLLALSIDAPDPKRVRQDGEPNLLTDLPIDVRDRIVGAVGNGDALSLCDALDSLTRLSGPLRDGDRDQLMSVLHALRDAAPDQFMTRDATADQMKVDDLRAWLLLLCERNYRRIFEENLQNAVANIRSFVAVRPLVMSETEAEELLRVTSYEEADFYCRWTLTEMSAPMFAPTPAAAGRKRPPLMREFHAALMARLSDKWYSVNYVIDRKRRIPSAITDAWDDDDRSDAGLRRIANSSPQYVREIIYDYYATNFELITRNFGTKYALLFGHLRDVVKSQ